jgi:lipopolysaccharide transport system ATP-binding protein
MLGSLKAAGIGKHFKTNARRRGNTLKRSLIFGFRRPDRGKPFWALREIDLEVASGEMVGIIGQNGSGKSTLLRILGRVMKPDRGTLVSTGRVGGILSLNAGMHEELSGRDNALIGCVVAGLTQRTAKRRIDEIIDFAELRDSIDNPVRTYSAGMRLRLGFAVATHSAPDILLIDEVLSVGDLAFQAKCLDRIRQFRKKGCAIVLVTHDMGQVEALCDRALLLKRGQIVASGSPKAVIAAYRADMNSKTRALTANARPLSGDGLHLGQNRLGSLELKIRKFEILDRSGSEIDKVGPDTPIRVRISYDGKADVVPILGLSIGSATSGEIVDFSSEGDRVAMPRTASGRVISVDIDRLDLAPGNYAFSVGLYEAGWEFAYDYHWRAYSFAISGSLPSAGGLSPPRSWSIETPD